LVKITDFSRTHYTYDNYEPPLGSEYDVVTYYMPPEIIISGNQNSVSLDLWYIGVISYILMSGYPPFHGDNDALQLICIMSIKYDYNDEAWDNITVLAKDFISKLLVLPEGRPTVREALDHSWIKSMKHPLEFYQRSSLYNIKMDAD